MLKALKYLADFLLDVLTSIIDEPIEYDDEKTYNYWMTLSYQEQFEYFHNNEYLKRHENEFYPNDRYLTACHMQRIADMYNRDFINKYDRY